MIELERFDLMSLLNKSKEASTWILIDNRLRERDDEIIELRRLLTIPNQKNWELINEKLRPIGVVEWRNNNNLNISSNTSIGG